MKKRNSNRKIQYANYYTTLISSANSEIKNILGLQGLLGTPEKNSDEKKFNSTGKVGVYHFEKILTDYPIELNRKVFNINTDDLRAVIRGLDPNQNVRAIGIGGENSLVNIVSIHKEKNEDTGELQLTDSEVAFECRLEDSGSHTLSDGDLELKVSGVATRCISFNKPVFNEGWCTNVNVTAKSTPSPSVNISGGGGWFRRNSLTASIKPSKYFIQKEEEWDTNATVVTANSRYDAIVSYYDSVNEVVKMLYVEGTEAASPSKVSDSDIETAVDGVLSGALWVRIADVLVDETTTVAISDSDISYEELGTNFMLYGNSVGGFEALKVDIDDDYFYHDYILACFVGDEWADACIFDSDSDTDFDLKAQTKYMVEVFYLVESYKYVC